MKMGLARAILQAQMRVFLKLFSGDWQCWMHLWFFLMLFFGSAMAIFLVSFSLGGHQSHCHQDADVVLLDEPTGHLDVAHGTEGWNVGQVMKASGSQLELANLGNERNHL
jgi:hypothetical protein